MDTTGLQVSSLQKKNKPEVCMSACACIGPCSLPLGVAMLQLMGHQLGTDMVKLLADLFDLV